MRTFPASDNRGKKLDLRSLRKSHNLIYHLVNRLFGNLPPALRTVRGSDSRIEETEIIIDLRHSSNRRTRVMVRGFLVNGDGRRKPFDTLHVRFLHLSQELSRIGRQ